MEKGPKRGFVRKITYNTVVYTKNFIPEKNFELPAARNQNNCKVFLPKFEKEILNGVSHDPFLKFHINYPYPQKTTL